MIELSPTHFVFLLNGALWTLVLSACALFGGGLLGIVVALARVSRVRPLSAIAGAYVAVIQGTPLLVLLFLLFFGMPAVGVPLTPLLSASIAMTIYVAAFLGEIWRGAINSIPRAQWEAADSIGLNGFQRMIWVIAPQAIKISIPPTVGFVVQIIKNTSLVSIVGFVELSRAAQIVNNSTLQPLIVYASVAILYFCMCYPISKYSRRLEKSRGYSRRKLTTESKIQEQAA